MKTLVFPKIVIVLFLCGACTGSRNIATVNHFPKLVEKLASLPPKDRFYIFILAGQSNMAGRGVVMPEDTISHPRILSINQNTEWVYAKEPLHFYEPSRTGLDCGLSFGRISLDFYDNDITIGLIPCAVGGSTIEQWLGDSVHRNVKLYSNFIEKVGFASQYGTIKGLLWHQGENNATISTYNSYKQKLESFFLKVRKDLNNENLPVFAGELASFLSKTKYPLADSINKDLWRLSESLNKMYVIKTSDLSPLQDSVHFNSISQRALGKRFATAAHTRQE